MKKDLGCGGCGLVFAFQALFCTKIGTLHGLISTEPNPEGLHLVFTCSLVYSKNNY